MTKARIEFEIPKNCAYCPLCHESKDGFYYCAVATEVYVYVSREERPDRCPLEVVE